MTTPPRTPDGYRRDQLQSGGPRLRADVVDVYVYRRLAADAVELLQLQRTREPLNRTWQPIMGHVEPGETATDAALRELREEVGLDAPSPALVGVWALEQVWPFFIAAIDCIVLSPRFAAEVSSSWEPTLNDEHSAHRWVTTPTNPDGPALRAILDTHFMWPGQRQAVMEMLREIVAPASISRDRLRIDLSARGSRR